MFRAQIGDQVDEVVLQLADIVDIAAPPARHVMSAQIGQGHLRRALAAQIRGERVVAAAVIGRAVNEDENALGGRIVEAVGQLLAVSRRVALERRQIGGGGNFPR